jgi:hypothetical protein
MVKTVSAKELFAKQLQVETIKGKNKVFKDYLKALEPKTSVVWKNQYGEEAVTWLSEMGLTEYNGFNPKVKSAESTDFYIGKELDVKVKGLSALPKVSDVQKREVLDCSSNFKKCSKTLLLLISLNLFNVKVIIISL